jgi:hypothetical protein
MCDTILKRQTEKINKKEQVARLFLFLLSNDLKSQGSLIEEKHPIFFLVSIDKRRR